MSRRSSAAARVCPLCGNRQDGLRCPKDGAITVERSIDEPRARLPFEPGTELDGRYVLGSVVGRGAFGAVYAAEQLSTGQRVAVKVLLPAPQGNRSVAEQRFRKEAKTLAQLRHPATVRIFDVGVADGGSPYFAMELVEGPNLEQVEASMAAEGRRFAEAEIIDVILPVLGSLAEAHGLGLVHRDLKPANLMLTQVADDDLVVKVLDFGVVRTENSELTGRANGLGTPRYMSPEQCRAEPVDGRSDLYSVGCVLYEALVGEVPFLRHNAIQTMYAQMMEAATPVEERAPDTSPEMAALVMRLLAKAPDARPATAAEVRAQLEALRRQRHGEVPRTRLRALFRDEVVMAVDGSGSVFVSQQVTLAVPRQGTSSAPIPTMIRDTPAESAAFAADGTPVAIAGAFPADGANGARHADTALDLAMPSAALHEDGAGEVAAAVESSVDTRDEDLTSGSQGLVRLPSPRVLEAAIEARRRALEARDAARREADTRVEVAEDQRRVAQQAPPSADEADGRARKALGSRTILGTGVPGKSRGKSGNGDPSA